MDFGVKLLSLRGSLSEAKTTKQSTSAAYKSKANRLL